VPSLRTRKTDQQRSDPELAAAALQGDELAFAELLRRCRRQIRGLVLHPMARPGEIEDLQQDIELRLWTRLASYDGSCAFSTWAVKVASRVGLNARKPRRVDEALSYCAEPPEHNGQGLDLTMDEMLAREERQITAAEARVALEALTEQERAVLTTLSDEGQPTAATLAAARVNRPQAAQIAKTAQAKARAAVLDWRQKNS
jgi:RNA polymerase sigma factor (sigma-70 family)